MHDGGNSHWGGARHERGDTSEQQQRRTASAIRSPSEEHRFNPYNRQFGVGRIYGGGGVSGHGDRDRRNIQHNHHPHQNEQSPPTRNDGRPEEDAEFDENNISDENIQEEEEGEEEEDEDGSEENDEDGRNSKERDGATKNEDGTCSLTFSMYHNQKPVKVRSMFVDKLFKMVEDPSIQHLISWAKEGDMFYVYNCVELSDTILPRFFKHNNWQSFVRQLNMYGFHKIYRYDRESTLNRKRPESQRWQFYHPQFQRDFPHLRANIKRKSARSMNTAPATSRVVFEHGKGYFLQRNDRSRSNSGEGPPHPPPPAAAGLGHMQGRHGENVSPTSRHVAAGRQPSLNDSPRDHHHPEGRGEMMAFPGYQRQHFQSDERYAVKASSVSPHAGPDPHHGRLPPPPGQSGFHPSSSDLHGPPSAPEERSAIAAVGHLRNHSLTRGVSYEKGSLFALGADAASSSPAPHHAGGPRVGHRNSDSALSPPSANGPNFGQPHHSQDSPHRPPRHHHHGSISDGPGAVVLPPFSGPPPLAVASGSSPSSSKAGDPYVVIKELEHRLQSVEEAYMSLKQYTQKLQQIQASQDRTIGWMRERIDQMSDVAAAHGRRDSITSPLTPQSTASFSGNKRRAEPSPEDARTRARFEQQGPPPSGPSGAMGAAGGPPSSIQSPDMHAYEHGRGHGRHESMSGPHHPQQQQHQQHPQQQQHAISSPQTGPYPRLLTSLGRIYS
ncbi:hypothetical protein BGZ96_005649 [Linnemannia gamsii]|uniref:HSF-type DNA-binding domain-containing protein n=1 Tax=Linnemannia gamsii TaxID=64522 RepID=A0ABQ7K3Q0_9FUNG|nr:hypothetical protein BGZ96_005649 [Linnemannia gamsii]